MQGRGRSEQGHGRWVPVRSEVLARGTQSSSVGCRMAFSFYGMSYGVDSGSGQKTRQCKDACKSDKNMSLSCSRKGSGASLKSGGSMMRAQG